MIARIWHGWTSPENENAYEKIFMEETAVNIGNKKIPGYKGIELLKRAVGNEVEFITIMYFDTMDAIKGFAGEDYEKAVVPEKAQKTLLRYDATSQHYEIIKRRED